ncbi:hypothetical protein HY091_00365 [Candidatus Kaiserbacteria bacterium]|nr:hypothetical protein [Candidatus Kaiserbacteria bacterium]
MTILYFGDYDPEYARNRVIISGLRQNGATVLECRTASRGFSGIRELARLHRKFRGKYDLLLVGYSDSRFMVPVARFLTARPVVWDAFYSLYDSWVYDRKLVSPGHPKAYLYRFLDWLNCALANKVLLDTDAHIAYFRKTFLDAPGRYARVLIGADDAIFHP